MLYKYQTGDLTMLGLLRKLFGGKTEEVKAPEAPYKTEAKVEAPTPVAEKASDAVVQSIAKPAPKKKAPPKKEGAPKRGRKPKAK